MEIKSNLSRFVLIASFVIYAGLTQTAIADEKSNRSDFYVTGSVGISNIYRNGIELSDDATRYELGIGVAINNWFSVELSRYEVEETQVGYPYVIPLLEIARDYSYGGYGETVELEGYSLLAKFRYEVNDFLAVYTKQGVSRNSVTSRFSYPDFWYGYELIYYQASENSFTDLDYRVSLGAEVNLKKLDGLVLFGEWTRDDGDFVVSESVNAGLTYRF